MIIDFIYFIFFISILTTFAVNIAPKYEDFKSKNKSKVKFDWVDDGFLDWIKLSGKKDKNNPKLKDQNYYVKWDHSGVILIIGKRRSGKGVTGYAIIKEFQKYDPERVIAIWKAPPQVVPYLRSFGINAVDVDRLQDVPTNSILFIDEGIINTNAKKALTNFAVELEQNLAILSHRRILLMITFQRWGVFASLVEMSDATIYKQLGSKMTNRATKGDKFLKENVKIINAMPKEIALIESSLDGFDGTGFLNIKLPDFYGSKLSESYKDAEMDFTLDARTKRQMELDDYSLGLARDGLIPSPSDKAMYHAMISECKHRFIGAKLKQSEITDIIQGIYRITRLHPYLLHGEEGVSVNLDNLFEETSENEWKMFKEFCDGVSSTDFKRYGMSKSNAMISIRKTGKLLLADYYSRQRVDKEGRKYERIIANHYVKRGDYFTLSPANDGTRGKYSMEADGIHFVRDGIRVVQIKARKGFVESFKAGSFDTELNIVEILKRIPYFEGKVSAWLYYIPKKVDPEHTWQIEISDKSRTKVTHVDYTHKLVEYNESNVKAIKTMNEKIKESEKNDFSGKLKLNPKDKRLKINMSDANRKIKIQNLPKPRKKRKPSKKSTKKPKKSTKKK